MDRFYKIIIEELPSSKQESIQSTEDRRINTYVYQLKYTDFVIGGKVFFIVKFLLLMNLWSLL